MTQHADPQTTAASRDRDPATLTARELVARYRDGTLSPVDVHDAVQAVIDRREPVLNAFWVRDPAASRAQAEASARRWRSGEPLGPLDGVPVTLKENLARRGVPMPAGTAAVDPVVPDDDAPVTARLLEAGAVVLGSTVMPDWGMLSSGVSSRHGVTRSPWDPAWTTGGSSSGAGAAAAGGYGPVHVGTDIGGSIRLPGTWLGLATLKPTGGRVPLAAPYLGRAAGPMARTVGDLGVLLSVIARPDARDWTSLPPAGDAGRVVRPNPPRGLRVALHLDAGCGAPVDPQVRAVVERAAAVFADGGARVEEIPPFATQDLLDDLDLFWRVRSWNDVRSLPPQRRAAAHPFVAQWALGGADLTGVRVLQAYQSIGELAARTTAATSGFDLVLSPVAPVAAFPAEQPMPFTEPGREMAHIAFTAPYNMSGQPAATVNAGFTGDGRPVGVQLAGRRFADADVLDAAAWFEEQRPDDAVPRWPDA